MLLQSISLKNFRQFRDESINFADGKDGRNVTIIFGENGTGKTAFAQAFFWCLYGETAFSDKSMLNRQVAKEMRPGQNEKVQVVLKLHHGEVDYKLIREQFYQKGNSNRLRSDNTTFDIAKKDASGNTVYVKKSLCEGEVKSILPKELSKYFFFDGERIEKMSKDISTGKKSNDFAEAVKGLLGLNAMDNAIRHLDPQRKTSVISSYEASYNSKSNEKIKEYSETIERCKSDIAEIDARIEELNDEIESAQVRSKEKSVEIKQYNEAKELQEKKEKLFKNIDAAEKSRSNVYKVISQNFNQNMKSFFSVALIEQALEILSKKEFVGKDIPNINAKTINYLLQQKMCICGTHLNEGSLAYTKVKELMDFIPPQSLSSTIGDFKKEAKQRASSCQDLQGLIKDNLSVISQQDDNIIDLKDDLTIIESKLSGGDVRDKVRTINNEIQLCDDTIRKDQTERDSKLEERGRREQEMDRANSERQKLALLDEDNKKNEIYKAYAERIYKELQVVYATSESEIRERLQTTINDIFNQIFDGGLSLAIDENYHISVHATDYEGVVETSTAQSISVIFAFITGIIKMVRDNRNATDENAQLLSSEPYPLVMDAPLSTFDKRRIKSVCTALPQTAEQVIILIKDTDGEIAEDYMGDHIGSRYKLTKKNDDETTLE